MKKICVKCGTKFESPKNYPDKILCDKCAAESIKNNVIRERVCVDCGIHFMGYPRSTRCEKCMDARRKETYKKYKERVKRGETRPLGSIDHCVKCGKEYVVNSGLQKYCPDCAKEAIRENDQAKSREWNRENRDNDERQRLRKLAKAEIPCVICGKMFTPKDASITCSGECSEELKKRNARKYEEAHKTELNEYRKKRIAAKVSEMSEGEYKGYREKINAKARENYAKRLNAMTDEELKAFREKMRARGRENYRKQKEKGQQ